MKALHLIQAKRHSLPAHGLAKFLRGFFYGLVLTGLALQAQAQVDVKVDSSLIHHSIKVILDPENNSLAASDTIRFPAPEVGELVTFALNSQLEIEDSRNEFQFIRKQRSLAVAGINSDDEGIETGPELNTYSFTVPANFKNQLTVSYSGRIFQQAQQSSAEYAQSFSESSGIISQQGVYLNKASVWIPEFNNELITFDLTVEFAPGASEWTAVSQGDRFGESGWRSSLPMEEVYLIAADFVEYSIEFEGMELLTYLRQPDDNLATRYMDATERYMVLYEDLLGAYPYSKFALIENFWETGYGMPSFTLLGEQVIRFPFILESSYPHEILHNWWGNGVYPDYDSGNWSEGLTAYLADHLFQEIAGAGAQYRKDMLTRYKNYVADGKDFPLSEFTSRNSAASQAVGYGKTLLLWHMLRLELGDEMFLTGLRDMYSRYKFQRISFATIENLFSEISERDLSRFFEQWVDRTGGPELSLSVKGSTDNQAVITVSQTQGDEPYQLTVPVALFYENESSPRLIDLHTSSEVAEISVADFDKLQAVSLDPYFDVFRKLDWQETPPTLGQLFGASEISFILPLENRQQWTLLAEAFAEGVDAEILFSEELTEIPATRSVWVLGKDNPFTAKIRPQLKDFAVEIDNSGVNMPAADLLFENRSSVLTATHPDNPQLALGWIHVDDMAAMPGMIEKLPHYGKYSYLSFLGQEPSNDVKGNWPAVNSPMQWRNPKLAATSQLPELPLVPALTQLPGKYTEKLLLRHISKLTATEMKGRAVGTAGLDLTADYIAEKFAEAGLQMLDDSYRQQWSQAVSGPDQEQENGGQEQNRRKLELSNVLALLPGTNPDLAQQPVILGAHFDHLGITETDDGPESYDPGYYDPGYYPGADDNASGISVLLEVAARLKRVYRPQRPILFVAFTAEENGLLGSRYFIEHLPAGYQQENLFAMINLDSVGRLEGRDLQLFGSDSAYEWPFMAQGIGYTVGVNSALAAATIASSDHVSFLNAGIPAIHLYSGVHEDYHGSGDTMEKLDLTGLTNVALWVEEALVYLGDRIEPLRATVNGNSVKLNSNGGSAREASLGTVPDFAFPGPGVRVTAVSAGGAAAEAGLEAGDVVMTYNDQSITDLQSYSNLLRQSRPGDNVELGISRAGETLMFTARLQAR